MGPPQAGPGMGMGPPAMTNQPIGNIPAPAGPAPPMGSPTKEANTAPLCRIGQEFVQDIVQKTLDIFNQLRAMQVRHYVDVVICKFIKSIIG